jgi:uncharacterized caspase-like protein
VQPAERLLRRPGRGRESRGCLNRPMVRRCPYYFGAGMKPVFASTAAPKGASSVAFTMYPRFNIMLICTTVSTDAVFVYVTGHDLQIGGENFVVPTDANFETAATLRKSALALSEIVDHAAQVAPSRIILLDARRDDPTRRAPRGDPTEPIASGLARIGRADGTIFAFSTAPGATAEDGGEHSPFAQALLAHLGHKGLEFGSVMKLVQMEVYDGTPEHQPPYVEDALPALFFAGAQAGPPPERDRLLLAMAKIDADTRAQVERIAKAKDVPLAPLYGSLVAGAALSGEDAEARERLREHAAENSIKARIALKTLASPDHEVA